eukprot:TRINITY_DN431_c1_g3_i1.p1 TRINITY_DN431_c1_g3~~TRINITY_DN431_c1_g3_i1.p1  ORF type:complete len:437 (-),score=89.38 TRINITY_DN431_c1_g3_i1:91-1401(-)
MADKHEEARFRGQWNPQIKDPVKPPCFIPIYEPPISPKPLQPPSPRHEPPPPPPPPPINEEPESPTPSSSLTREEEDSLLNHKEILPDDHDHDHHIEEHPTEAAHDDPHYPEGKQMERKGNIKINSNVTPLMRATYDVDLNEFMKQIKLHPEEVNVTEDLQGYTPILVAAETSNDQHALILVKHLVEAGANRNCRDKSGFTPFLQACSKGNLETVKYLVSLGEDIHQENHLIRATGFYLAAEKGHVHVLGYLHSLGANVNHKVVKGYQSYSALLMCAQKGNLELVKWLVEHGADINLRCSTAEKNAGITALHHASSMGQLEIVQYLVSKGGAVNDKDNDLGASPIIFAAKTGKTEVVKHLIEVGANPNDRRKDGAFPLFLAAQNGFVKTVRILLEKGADPNMVFGKKITALMIAKEKKHTEVVKLLNKHAKECRVM